MGDQEPTNNGISALVNSPPSNPSSPNLAMLSQKEGKKEISDSSPGSGTHFQLDWNDE